MSGSLYRIRQLPLVSRADPADPAREDLASLGIEVREQLPVLVIDVRDFLRTELADSLAPNRKSLSLNHDF